MREGDTIYVPDIGPAVRITGEGAITLDTSPTHAEVICLRYERRNLRLEAVPHAEMGEELRALVVLEPGESATDGGIIDYCRERLSSFKCPRSVEFVDDLGRNTMGKINKRKLRDAYWDGHENKLLG